MNKNLIKTITITIFIILLILIVKTKFNINNNIIEGLNFESNQMKEVYNRNNIKLNKQMKFIEYCKNDDNCKKIYYYHKGNDTISTYLSDNKCTTNYLLKKNGIPVPNFICIKLSNKFINNYHNIIKTKLNENNLKFPVVMKLSNGSYGMNIKMNITTINELLKEFDKMLNIINSRNLKSNHIIIEEMKTGYRDYRILISNGNIVKITEKIEVSIIGDGISTIQQLIQNKKIHSINKEIIKKNNQVLQKGEKLVVSDIKNGKNGATIKGISINSIHPDNVKLMRNAMDIIGLTVSGIDYLTPDITKSWREVGGVILEMNSNPANVERNIYDKQTYNKQMDILVNSIFN